MVILNRDSVNSFKFYVNSASLPSNYDVKMIRLQAEPEKNSSDDIGYLYDTLADAVDEINDVFSREVNWMKSFDHSW